MSQRTPIVLLSSLSLSLGLAFSSAGCERASAPSDDATAENTPGGAPEGHSAGEPMRADGTEEATSGDPVVRRGEPLGEGETVSLATVLEAPERYAGKTLRVEGPVRTVCQNKGCWMELGEAGGPAMRVTFKDYAFFMPTDAAGRLAQLEGTVEVVDVPEEEAEHLEGEGAKVARVDGKPREVRFVATGVELHRQG